MSLQDILSNTSFGVYASWIDQYSNADVYEEVRVSSSNSSLLQVLVIDANDTVIDNAAFEGIGDVDNWLNEIVSDINKSQDSGTETDIQGTDSELSKRGGCGTFCNLNRHCNGHYCPLCKSYYGSKAGHSHRKKCTY